MQEAGRSCRVLYAAFAVTNDLRLGIGVNSPFGLKTDYETPWLGQYQAIHSKLETINVNPSIAYRLNNVVSLGAGVNWQRAKAELEPVPCISEPAGDGVANIEGDSDALGLELSGAMFQLSDGYARRRGLPFQHEAGSGWHGRRSAGLPGYPPLWHPTETYRHP